MFDPKRFNLSQGPDGEIELRYAHEPEYVLPDWYILQINPDGTLTRNLGLFEDKVFALEDETSRIAFLPEHPGQEQTRFQVGGPFPRFDEFRLAFDEDGNVRLLYWRDAYHKRHILEITRTGYLRLFSGAKVPGFQIGLLGGRVHVEDRPKGVWY